MQATGFGRSTKFSTEAEGRGPSLVHGKDLETRKQPSQECITLGRLSRQTDSVCLCVVGVALDREVFMRSSSLLLLT